MPARSLARGQATGGESWAARYVYPSGWRLSSFRREAVKLDDRGSFDSVVGGGVIASSMTPVLTLLLFVVVMNTALRLLWI